jgi:hypothetical protein
MSQKACDYDQGKVLRETTKRNCARSFVTLSFTELDSIVEWDNRLWRSETDFEGSDHGLIEVQSQQFAAVTEGNNDNFSHDICMVSLSASRTGFTNVHVGG